MAERKAAPADQARTPVVRATPEEIESHRAALEAYRRQGKLGPGPRLWDQLTPPESGTMGDDGVA